VFAQLSAQSLHVVSMRTKTNRLEELFIRLVQDKDKEERRSA
jgi:ABC-2 type transport system ATP-binding protein